MVGVVALVALLAGASAQDPAGQPVPTATPEAAPALPETAPAAAPEAAPGAAPGAEATAAGEAPVPAGDVVPVVVAPPWATSYHWRNLGLLLRVTDVAATDAGIVLALDTSGALWRNERGRSWTRVLGPLEDELDAEALLLDTELAVGELQEDVDEDELEEEALESGDVESLEEGIIDTTEGLETTDLDEATDDAVDLGILDSTERAQEETVERIRRVHAAGGVVLVVRDDEVVVSLDGARSFRPVEVPTPPHAFLVAGSSWFLGGAAGLYRSEDQGRSWVPVIQAGAVDDLERGPDNSLLFVEDGILVMLSPEGDATVVRGLANVIDVAVGSGELWALAQGGIHRLVPSEGEVRGWSVQPRASAPADTEGLLGTDVPGRLLTYGSTGVWEGVDGVWARLGFGMGGAAVHAFVRSPRGPVSGGDRGVLVLTPGMQVDGARDVDHAPALGEVVEHALSRAGVSFESTLLARNIARSLLVPKLTLSGNYQIDTHRAADFEADETSGANDRSLTVTVFACFGACGTTSVATVEELDQDSDLIVMGDEVYDVEDAGTYAPAAAGVAQEVGKYRLELVSTLADLYASRAMIRFELEGLADTELTDRVQLALDLDEVEARLDVYSDGYFTRVLETTPGGS